jgi:5'-nucleotidase
VAQDLTPFAERFVRRLDPKGRTYFWTSPETPLPDAHPHSDVVALAEGYVTITPLQFNLTHWERLATLAGQEWSL